MTRTSIFQQQHEQGIYLRLPQLHLGCANTITTASIVQGARGDRLTEQLVQDGEERFPSLTFGCVEITRGDKERADCLEVTRWYLELYTVLHVASELSECWFINGDGRSTSRMGASNDKRVILLQTDEVRDSSCTRGWWFRLGYLNPCVVICKPLNISTRPTFSCNECPTDLLSVAWKGYHALVFLTLGV